MLRNCTWLQQRRCSWQWAARCSSTGAVRGRARARCCLQAPHQQFAPPPSPKLPQARATLSACKEGDALRTCGDIGTDRLQQLMACCESKAAHGGAAWERRRSADARTAASTANAQKEQGQQPQEGDEPPAPEVARPDLQEMFYGPAPRYLYGKCTEQASAAIPVFGVDPDTAKPTVRIESQTVPALRGAAVSAVSDRALANAPPAVRARARDLRVTAKHRRSVFNWFSGFSHPGGYIGASDVALMQARLAAGAPLQVAALDDLLNVSRGYQLQNTLKVYSVSSRDKRCH